MHLLMREEDEISRLLIGMTFKKMLRFDFSGVIKRDEIGFLHSDFYTLK